MRCFCQDKIADHSMVLLGVINHLESIISEGILGVGDNVDMFRARKRQILDSLERMRNIILHEKRGCEDFEA